MSDFDLLPNKKPARHTQRKLDIWPELGPNFILNEFYRHYAGAEGWLDKGYLVVWAGEEVQNYREKNFDAYPEKYHFFASDGGGTQFGFFAEDQNIIFVSAPDIGNEADIRFLGGWSDLLRAIELGDYI